MTEQGVSLPLSPVIRKWAILTSADRHCVAFAHRAAAPEHRPQISFDAAEPLSDDLIKYTITADCSSIATFRAWTGLADAGTPDTGLCLN